MSINKAILIGNLGGDPDVKVFNDGAKIATISLATSERWTDKQTGEKKEATEWHRVVFNNRLAEIAESYLHKGSKVYVEGAIKTRKYTDKQGIERYTTEIRAVSLQMLDGKSDGNSNGNTHQGGYGNTKNGYQDSYQDYQSDYPPSNYPSNSYHANGYQNNPPSPNQTPPRNIGGGFKEMAAMGKTGVQDEDMPF